MRPLQISVYWTQNVDDTIPLFQRPLQHKFSPSFPDVHKTEDLFRITSRDYSIWSALPASVSSPPNHSVKVGFYNGLVIDLFSNLKISLILSWYLRFSKTRRLMALDTLAHQYLQLNLSLKVVQAK